MRSACDLHDREKCSRALGVRLGRALQRLDESREGRERRAQLVAGIGDEVGAHALDLLFARQVAQHDQRALAGA